MKRKRSDIGNPISTGTSTPFTPASGGQIRGGTYTPLPLQHTPDYRASGRQKGAGTLTFVHLPNYNGPQMRRPKRIALPPALLAMQLNAQLQLQAHLHLLLDLNVFSSPFSKGRPRGILKKKVTRRKISPCPHLYKRGGTCRMTQMAHYSQTNANVKSIGFTYDAAGNLTGYNDGTTSAAYTYDALYRKTEETVHYGAFSLTTRYAYNANGTKKSFTYPNGMAVDYTYDANNQLTGVNIPYAGNISYNAYQWTRPTAVTLPSSSGTKAYAYDELMRARTILSKDPSQNPVMNYQYTYDKMDNIKTRNTQTNNYAYTYDNLYRLSEVKKDEIQTETYTYDPVGNRQTSMQATDWTHNQNNELLSLTGSSGQSGAATYQYDANGNTIQRNINGTIQNFVYDVDNRLIEVRDAANALIAKYTYDPFGRRIKKEIPSPLAGEGQGEGGLSPSGGGQGEEVFYHYSDEGLIGEYDNTGNQRRIYGYKPNSTWSTDPLFMREGGNIYFYHNDHLGTPQKLTNISGATVWSATYDAFGKAAIDGASTVVSHLRFPGQYFDGETGLHYNWNRYYEPGTGRYVTSDPIGFGGKDVNLHRYVFNNPINLMDMLGLECNCGPDLTHWLTNLMQSNSAGVHAFSMKTLNQQSIRSAMINPIQGAMYKLSAYAYFTALVWDKQPWDLKHSYRLFDISAGSCPSPDCKGSVTLCGGCYHYDVPGNIHYGYVGRAAGLSLNELVLGASIAQYADDVLKRKSSPKFDSIEDSNAVRVGWFSASNGLCSALSSAGKMSTFSKCKPCCKSMSPMSR